MPSLHSLSRKLEGIVPRSVMAVFANRINSLCGDTRRFSTMPGGLWVNRQPDATFVSRDMHTGWTEQVRATALETWCPFYTPTEGDVVIDVGAGIGEETIIFSNMVGPTGRIIAIEAHPATFACLNASIDHLKFDNALPLQLAIADQRGTVFISDDDAHLGNSIIQGQRGISVESKSIDDVARDLKLERIDMLKMNIEGAERLAVQGMSEIAAKVRHVAISCHDFVADAGGDESFRTLSFVRDQLQLLGFRTQMASAPKTAWDKYMIYGDRADQPGTWRSVVRAG